MHKWLKITLAVLAGLLVGAFIRGYTDAKGTQ